jgi:hypothetical protein
MVNGKFSKKIIAILLVMVLVATIGLIVFFQLSQESNSKVEPAAPVYIANSKIFLLSSTSSYGFIGGNPLSPCFSVRVTIRNDYTSQQPVDNIYNDSHGTAWFIMYAKLYDKNGNQIQSQAYIPPNGHPNSNQQNIASNETETLSISMVTSNRNIDHYSLAFGYIGTIPAP